MVEVLFFLMISSASVFGAVFLGKKYEEMLPIGIFSIIICGYVFGLFGALKWGVYVIIILSIACYLIGIVFAIQRKQVKNALSNLLTPGFLSMLLIYAVINYANYGKLASSWDEFSHWADVVKAMISIDDFSTNPLSLSMFKSYVPAMPIFQYAMQVLGRLVKPDYVFNEAWLYVAYQTASYGILVYFMHELTWKNWRKAVLVAAIIFLIPSCFYAFYHLIYIDAFLGILAGCTFGYLLYDANKNKVVDRLRLLLGISCLVLTKDAGFYIAIFMTALVVIKEFLVRKSEKKYVCTLLAAVVTVTFLIAPKLTWDMELAQNNIGKAFGNPVSINEFFGFIVGGSREGYRWETLQNFGKQLVSKSVGVGDISIFFSNVLFLVVFLAVISVMLMKLYDKEDQRLGRMLSLGLIVFSCAYVVSMCLMYMYKFSTYEAVRLASFARYISILFTMLMIVAWVLVLKLFAARHMSPVRWGAMIMLLLFIPSMPVFGFLSRGYVRLSHEERKPYTQSTQKIQSVIPKKDAKIFIVHQSHSGLSRLVFRFTLRPMRIADEWSIGEPFFEGDVWTRTIDAKTWMKELLVDTDYVYLYHINDYFLTEFSSCFDDPDAIANGNIFYVDKEKVKLVFVE